MKYLKEARQKYWNPGKKFRKNPAVIPDEKHWKESRDKTWKNLKKKILFGGPGGIPKIIP